MERRFIKQARTTIELSDATLGDPAASFQITSVPNTGGTGLCINLAPETCLICLVDMARFLNQYHDAEWSLYMVQISRMVAQFGVILPSGTEVKLQCATCGKTEVFTADALFRGWQRDHEHWLCIECPNEPGRTEGA